MQSNHGTEALGPQVAKYLTTEEVAERFRTAPSTIRYWKLIGKGPRAVRPGRRVLYALADVEAFERGLRNGDSVA